MRHRMVMALGALLVASVLGVGGALVFRDEASPRQPLLTSNNGCQAGGVGAITVPNVVGKSLGDAITAVRARGLLVIGNGLPAGDPSEFSAIVRAQKPPAGMRVIAGACIGFRTNTWGSR